MQAIARVNRVYKDKPGGLIIDYIGIISNLKKALATYTTSGGKGKPALDQSEAIAVMLENVMLSSRCSMALTISIISLQTPKAK